MEGQLCTGPMGFFKETSKAKPSKRSNKKRPTVDVSSEYERELDENQSSQHSLIAVQPQKLSATPPNAQSPLHTVIHYVLAGRVGNMVIPPMAFSLSKR